jgi:hypothetical protein
MDVRLHIERLVVDGTVMQSGGAAALGGAVGAELTRLLAGDLPPMLRTGAAVPVLRANAAPVGKDGRQVPLGSQVAQAVYRSLGS